MVTASPGGCAARFAMVPKWAPQAHVPDGVISFPIHSNERAKCATGVQPPTLSLCQLPCLQGVRNPASGAKFAERFTSLRPEGGPPSAVSGVGGKSNADASFVVVGAARPDRPAAELPVGESAGPNCRHLPLLQYTGRQAQDSLHQPPTDLVSRWELSDLGRTRHLHGSRQVLGALRIEEARPGRLRSGHQIVFEYYYQQRKYTV